MSTIEAIVIGSLGGILATVAGEVLLTKFRLDDPVDVVATHGIAGAFGTLAVAFVGPESALATASRVHQFFAQLLGVTLVFSFVCIATYTALKLIQTLTPLRVSAADEEIGLNYSEHGESVGSARMQRALETRINNQISFNAPIDIASNDEHSELASAMNQLLDKHEMARREIELSEKRFQNFAQTASNWLWETNPKMEFKYFSGESENNDISMDLSQMISASFFEIFKIEKEEKYGIEQRIANREAIGVFEARMYLTIPTQSIQAEVRGVPFYAIDGDFLGYRGTVNDITPRKAAENRAVFLSLHDDLTGMLNRRALNEKLPKLLTVSKNNDKTTVIAGIDLDGFKAVNDNYGHQAGDSLLKEVARRLDATLRPEDIAFRTGGDEFIIVMNGFEKDDAQSQAETICNNIINQLSRPYKLDTSSVEISASIGIAMHPLHNEEGADLIRLADLALYAAKADGKSRVVAFEPKMDADVQRKFALENDLQRALEEDQFYLVYQPLINTLNQQMIGFEALIRWNHPEHGEVPPGDFIYLAEQLPLINDIGKFVLEEACEFAAQWKTETGIKPPCIAVNVSPVQLRDNNFLAVVEQALQKTGLEPSRLELEITEDVLVSDFDNMRDKLVSIREIGVGIAIDDFGSGQTSLRYLTDLPISKLKIDRSFGSIHS